MEFRTPNLNSLSAHSEFISGVGTPRCGVRAPFSRAMRAVLELGEDLAAPLIGQSAGCGGNILEIFRAENLRNLGTRAISHALANQ